jgi:uncharacterized protein (DUF305 family)
VQMAMIALQRAQHQELRDLAQEMMEVQAVEINDMQAWREQWYGSRETPPMNMTAQIEALRAAPEPFDVAFIDAITPLQARAIDQSRQAILDAGQQDILDIAGAILESHSRYALQMQDWRAQW